MVTFLEEGMLASTILVPTNVFVKKGMKSDILTNEKTYLLNIFCCAQSLQRGEAVTWLFSARNVFGNMRVIREAKQANYLHPNKLCQKYEDAYSYYTVQTIAIAYL